MERCGKVNIDHCPFDPLLRFDSGKFSRRNQPVEVVAR
jgi:hypothetical protein